MKLVIITSHPIQYNAPLFLHLARYSNFRIKVFYTLGGEHNSICENDFGVVENWNIDLLSGYDYEFIENTSRVPSSNSFWGIKNPTLLERVKQFDPSAILIYGWKYYSHISVMKSFHGKIPIYFRGDSTILDDKSYFYFFNLVRYTILNLVYRYVDYALSPGKASDEYFIKCGLSKSQIIRAEHSVDNERFQYFSEDDQCELQKIRTNLSIKEDEMVFLYAGKFIDKKNPLLLIQAFELLCNEEKSCRLILIGSGILEKKLKSYIAHFTESVKSKIIFLPFQDQIKIKLFYRLANVFVLPSKGPRETWGLSVNESLASGTPVLVSDVCGCAGDLVINDYNGYIFKSNDLSSLHINMKKYLISDNYIRLKGNSFESIKKFNFKGFHTSLSKVLNS